MPKYVYLTQYILKIKRETKIKDGRLSFVDSTIC